uniref:Uncharacterized protein n=1 Tax=viral metagenome TaxID=1070528 RepID=A0A6C0H3X6_9ZZZZ
MPNYTKKRNRSGRKGRGLSQRVLQTMRRFLPWSSKPQYMPVEVPPMKTQEKLREERIGHLVDRVAVGHYPDTVPKNERWKLPGLKNETTIKPFFMSTLPKKTIIKKTARKLPNIRRLRSSRSSRKLRSSAN